VDFVARIQNDDGPVLQAVEVIDRSGNWDALRCVSSALC
jgi:hypothetical protein